MYSGPYLQDPYQSYYHPSPPVVHSNNIISPQYVQHQQPQYNQMNDRQYTCLPISGPPPAHTQTPAPATTQSVYQLVDHKSPLPIPIPSHHRQQQQDTASETANSSQMDPHILPPPIFSGPPKSESSKSIPKIIGVTETSSGSSISSISSSPYTPNHGTDGVYGLAAGKPLLVTNKSSSSSLTPSATAIEQGQVPINASFKTPHATGGNSGGVWTRSVDDSASIHRHDGHMSVVPPISRVISGRQVALDATTIKGSHGG
ncbi:hypothetical protein CANARDRAFT_28948 [[Candida] arabinofermentans NRRL YB-2248]|uniref:Uncharacterized protein n=1 Tax=[Candida] arabinofermentans NRRL YB-2248 TaxID=983967 RepID=A0A1E4SZ87_9ASCO|nr:hypothetical protein CANARDRAFT_28948 [[Candida] arabinofermentans NRRL YB-2248]